MILLSNHSLILAFVLRLSILPKIKAAVLGWSSPLSSSDAHAVAGTDCTLSGQELRLSLQSYTAMHAAMELNYNYYSEATPPNGKTFWETKQAVTSESFLFLYVKEFR